MSPCRPSQRSRSMPAPATASTAPRGNRRSCSAAASSGDTDCSITPRTLCRYASTSAPFVPPASNIGCQYVNESLGPTPGSSAPREQLHTWVGDRFESVSWGDLTRQAERKAAGLRKLGVGEGSNVACVLTNTRDVCASILGIWMAGGTVVSLPIPARGMAIDDYQAQIGRICSQVDAQLLLAEDGCAKRCSGHAGGWTGRGRV